MRSVAQLPILKCPHKFLLKSDAEIIIGKHVAKVLLWDLGN